jgi:carboxylate-amine ligase
MLRVITNNLAKKLGFSHDSQIDNDTQFRSAGFLTLGAEVELQLLDKDSLKLSPGAIDLLNKFPKSDNIKKEFFLSTVEANTNKQDNVHGIKKDLETSLDAIALEAEKLGLKVATTGCHPFSKYSDCVIYPSDRYSELIDRNQWLTKRMTVYGLHIHLGLRSGDECINYINFFLRFIPHLLALSSSSPYWQGEDTGLSSCRPTTYEALPTAGLPYWFNSWAEFEHLYHSLKEFKSINSNNDLWWDIRPSPKFGTLEIRVCDGVATLAETVAITAFVHLLAHWFSENSDWITSLSQPNRWILRENKWRAIRYGLNAEIITNPLNGIKLIKDDISDWVEKLRPYAEKLGYQEYLQTILDICRHGNSSERQRKVFEKTGSLEAVVQFNVDEFNNKIPIVES